jgi:hypothetical protein
MWILQPTIETSVNENSRAQGSRGSRAVYIAELSSSPTVELHDPMIMQISNSASSSIVPSTSQKYDDTKSNTPTIRYSDDGRHDGVFWRIYDELESASDNREKTVSGQELKSRLVSSNKFFVGDAVLIIERMIRTGKLCIIGFDTYQRKND